MSQEVEKQGPSSVNHQTWNLDPPPGPLVQDNGFIQDVGVLSMEVMPGCHIHGWMQRATPHHPTPCDSFFTFLYPPNLCHIHVIQFLYLYMVPGFFVFTFLYQTSWSSGTMHFTSVLRGEKRPAASKPGPHRRRVQRLDHIFMECQNGSMIKTVI